MSTFNPIPITMNSGTSLRIILNLTDTSGNPLDISNAQNIQWVLQETPQSTSNLVLKSLGTDIVITNASGGSLYIDINPSDTSGINGRYYQEARLTDSQGNIYTILQRYLQINQSAVYV